MIPVVVWVAGGIAGLLGIARVRAVKAKAAAAAAAPATPAPATPAQVASITPTQVAAAAQSAGVTVAQLDAAATAAGTTPQAVIAAAQNAGTAVADAIIAAQNAAANGAPPPPAPAQAQTNPGQQARVTTNDPAPSGDLAIRSQPDDNAPIIGSAEKDGVVIITDANAGPGYSAVTWPGGSRLPPVTGFAHSQFLNTSFNGDGYSDASETADYK